MLKIFTPTPDNQAGYSNGFYSPQDNHCEIINGELSIIPNPGTRHQHVSMRLTANLFQILEGKGLGIVLGAPCSVMLSPWDIVQPDALFIRKNRRGIIGERIILGPPDLIEGLFTHTYIVPMCPHEDSINY